MMMTTTTVGGNICIIYSTIWTTSRPGRSPRGLVYQQQQNKRVMLITAHWTSPAQHKECIASDLNQKAMAAMTDLIVLSEMRFFHVDGVYMFSSKTLDAGLVSIARLRVVGSDDDDNKARVEDIWHKRAKMLLPEGHVAGWRIERDEEGGRRREEYVVVGPWEEESAMTRFADGTWDGAEVWDGLWMGVLLDWEVTTYRRLA
ncbi:hypothetical protein GGS20DRAFT_556812 [Poronia punctata]|nr:hypothetical protein GGS20DRAFT_556812 [Poronia punctata]